MHTGSVDPIALADYIRYYVVIVALWLAAVFLRLAYNRVRDSGIPALWSRHGDHVHPLSNLGLALLMFVGVLRRFDNLGKPADIFLWLVFAGTTLVLIGVLINVHFTLTPPWRRQDRR